jgi:hypothetical protein
MHTQDQTGHETEAPTFRFDRRRVPRRPMNGAAMAIFSGGVGAGTLARVELIDASWTGIGVMSDAPVEIGASCSLTPESPMWPRQIGIVVRCERDGDRYRIGLRSRTNSVAA